MVVPLRHDRGIGEELAPVIGEHVVFELAAELVQRHRDLTLLLGDEIVPDPPIGQRYLRCTTLSL